MIDERDGVGLLEHLAETALDDDYYVFRPAPRTHRRVRNLVFALVLAVAGLLATPAALQVRAQSSAAELERRTLVKDVVAQQTDQARGQAILDQLQLEVRRLEEDRGVEPDDYRDLAASAGGVAVHGPGLRIRVQNGRGTDGVVGDTDLQLLVNGLWHAGAEAVSLDDERVGSLTSIRGAGDAVTVNYRSIRAPYDILVIGDADTMESRFEQSPIGRYWELRHRRAGIGFTMIGSPDVLLPAVPPRRLAVTHAEVLSEGETP